MARCTIRYMLGYIDEHMIVYTIEIHDCMTLHLSFS